MRKQTLERFDFTPVETSVITSVIEELHLATKLHGPLGSKEEGYAAIKKQFDQLWKAICEGDERLSNHQARSVAAMAIRFLLDGQRWGKSPWGKYPANGFAAAFDGAPIDKLDTNGFDLGNLARHSQGE